MIYLSWTTFKAVVDAQSLPITAVLQATGYFLMTSDTVASFESFVTTATADYTDFTTNYLPTSNTALAVSKQATQSTSPWVVSGTVTSNLGTLNGAAIATQQYYRPSQMPGRTRKLANVSAVTAATTVVYTVTGGKTLYILSYGITATNTDAITKGNINISDDTTVIMPLTEAAGPGAATGFFSDVLTLAEPLPFSTNVSLKILAGTITASFWFIGYEE